MECQYDHTAVRDTLDRSQVMKDQMILRIGKNVSQFYSWYTLQGDSMWTDPTGRKIAIDKTLESIRTRNNDNLICKRTNGYIYKSYPQKGIITTYITQGGEDMKTPIVYLYFSEETPRQAWKCKIPPNKYWDILASLPPPSSEAGYGTLGLPRYPY